MLFLVITGEHAMAQQADVFNIESLPFKDKSADVTAVAVSDEFFFAFNEAGEGLKVLFGSNRAETIVYDSLENQRIVRDAKILNDNRVIVVGDNNLFRILDHNKWRNLKVYDFGFTYNFKLFIEGTRMWYAIPDSGAMNSIRIKDERRFSVTSSEDLLWNKTDIQNGLTIDGTSILISSVLKIVNQYTLFDHKSVFSSFCTQKFFDFDMLYYDYLPDANDSIFSSLAKDNIIYAIGQNVATGKFFLNKTNTAGMISHEEINCLYPGDYLFAKGYVFPNGEGYFFGKDINGNKIKIDLNMVRSNLDCNLESMTCLNGKNQKVVIGGESGQVAISSYLTKTDIISENDISVFKNGDKIIISENVEWSLFSSTGSFITSGKGSEISITLEKGIYLLQIKTRGGNIVKKIII